MVETLNEIHAEAELIVAGAIACKAALSAVQQRRSGAREPARVLYYGAHSLLRALRQHLDGPEASAPVRC